MPLFSRVTTRVVPRNSGPLGIPTSNGAWRGRKHLESYMYSHICPPGTESTPKKRGRPKNILYVSIVSEIKTFVILKTTEMNIFYDAF